jgi:hypothetical protein
VNIIIDKESLTLLKKIVNIPKEDMEYYHWAIFTHEFFSRTCKFEETNSKTFFGKNSLLHDFVSLGNFLSTKFMKRNR